MYNCNLHRQLSTMPDRHGHHDSGRDTETRDLLDTISDCTINTILIPNEVKSVECYNCSVYKEIMFMSTAEGNLLISRSRNDLISPAYVLSTP